ncbi:MAG: transporter substrate-binding protein [Clostridia bacterium]|nr:transporter substrate-binding protein [Clostridia bacterium]
MKLIKKVGLGVMAVSLAMNAVACSKVQTSNEGTASTAVETKASDQPIEIEFWYGLGGALGENMQKIVDDFNSSQTNIVIKTAVQGDYEETMQKLQAAFADGNVPEVVVLNSERADGIARNGMAYSFQPFIDEDPTFNIDDLVSAFRNQGTYNNELVTMPAYGTTQVLYYNKAVLEENGFTEADLISWQDLAEVAKKVAQVDASGKVTYAGWEPMWGAYNMMDAVFAAGGQVISDDGKKVMINDEKWVEVWEQFRKWIHEDKIMKVQYGGQGWEYWYKTIDDVMQDRALGYTGSAGDQGDLDFEKLAAAVQPGWNGRPAKAMAGAQMYVMPKGRQSEEQNKAAYEFVKFATNAENTARWAMNTGYIAVRNSAAEVDFYKEYLEQNPQAKVPMIQADAFSSVDFIDPTGGKIYDALKIAVDKVQIENIDAKTALDEASKKAQAELDKIIQ